MFKKSNKCIPTEGGVPDGEEEEKRVEGESARYYVSQKYLRSKKSIEGAIPLSSKLKKKSAFALAK